MASSIQNAIKSVSTNIAICTLIPPGSIVAPILLAATGIVLNTGQNTTPMLKNVAYMIVGGTTGVGTVLTFQELGADGTWRSMTNPAAITLTNSGIFNGTIVGAFNGLQLLISGVVGNGVAFAELKSTVI